MRWYRANAYRRVVTGTDEVNNPVTELMEAESPILVRLMPWEPSHDGTEGNSFHMVERTLLTKAAQSRLDGVSAIEVRGVVYEVVAMNNDAQTTAIRVRRCKHGLRDS